MKLDILAFGAHPDDVELSCGGTLAKEIYLGKKVGIIDLTRGELGTRGTIADRDQEASLAAEILGLTIRENLNLKDGFFVNDQASQLLVIEMIRKYQPDIVICNAIKDRHIDHAKGSDLVSHACFLSGLRKIETYFNGQIQSSWRPKRVYHYIQWETIQPDFVVDVSDFMDKKLASVFAYQSQFFDTNSKEPLTPIATKNFQESITYRAKDLGRLVGVDYAEGFTVEHTILVENLSKIK
jgi:bacillithiol biosynthesis deacetylase BshB1